MNLNHTREVKGEWGCHIALANLVLNCRYMILIFDLNNL